MTVKMILAVDEGNAIGWEDGSLPWKIPADMKRFKELTTGHDVLMGWKTFISLKRPHGLPNRTNHILTRKSYAECAPFLGVDAAKVHEFTNSPARWLTLPQEVRVTDTFQDYVRAHQEVLGGKPKDLWIIGGAEVYMQAIVHKLVDEIYVTRVAMRSGATVRLPFDLYDIEKFIDHQDAYGVQWTMHERMVQKQDDLSFDFTTLKKTQ